MALTRIVDRAVASGDTIRVVGAGHSFTPAAATNGVQVSLDRLDQLEIIAPIPGTDGECLVTVGAGIRLHALNELLAEHGLAMPNLGDIDQQSLAGALSTGTHGTGAALPGLAAQVHGMRILLASGSVIEVSQDQHPEVFQAARVSVGALGILLAVTIRCVPAFLLRARETPMQFDEVMESLDEFADTNDHFEFFWFPGTQGTLTKFNNRVPEGTPTTVDSLNPAAAAAYSARSWLDDELLSNGLFQFTNSLSARIPQLTGPLNVVASKALSPREYVAPSHEVFVSPRRVRFIEMEYAVPRAALSDVLQELTTVANRRDLAIQFPVEVRFAAADDVWLSTAHERDCAYIAVHQYQHSPYREYFDAAEAIFRAAGGRPHWGKMHSLTRTELTDLYPRFEAFCTIREKLDPRGLFANFYTNQVFGKLT
jgi:FAD-linked oxidoreductase